MSNAAWDVKRQDLAAHSKLHLSAQLTQEWTWDESRIVARGRWLADQLERVWPGPGDSRWGGHPKAGTPS